MDALAIDLAHRWLYVGGDFDFLGGDYQCGSATRLNHIARWDLYPAGIGRNMAQMGKGFNDAVNSLDLDGAGNLYVGGDFNQLCTVDDCTSGSPMSFIAEWVYDDFLPYGSWSSFGGGSSQVVQALKK